MAYIRTPPYLYVHQVPAALAQANPVSGTKYTVLDTTPNARIIDIFVEVIWTVQPTPLEVHITIDGQALIITKTNPVSGTDYFAMVTSGELVTVQPLLTDAELSSAHYRPFLLEGRSVKVEVETTGGTVQNLNARVVYAAVR